MQTVTQYIMKRSILIFLFLLAVLPLAAAPPLRVRGTVKDARTGEPVPGAVVKLDENYLWAVTGLEGEFELEGV